MTVLTDLSSKRLILARAGFIEQDGLLLNQRTARIDIHSFAKDRLNEAYLCMVLNSRKVREQTIATSRGSTVFHTSPTRMLAATWPLPSIKEQLEIVETLGTLEREYRRVCEGLTAELVFLNEYRARLIADVVTGKLDVRKAAAELPEEAVASIGTDPADEAEDPELIDEEATEA